MIIENIKKLLSFLDYANDLDNKLLYTIKYSTILERN
jgi:hypothetical protein